MKCYIHSVGQGKPSKISPKDKDSSTLKPVWCDEVNYFESTTYCRSSNAWWDSTEWTEATWKQTNLVKTKIKNKWEKRCSDRGKPSMLCKWWSSGFLVGFWVGFLSKIWIFKKKWSSWTEIWASLRPKLPPACVNDSRWDFRPFAHPKLSTRSWYISSQTIDKKLIYFVPNYQQKAILSQTIDMNPLYPKHLTRSQAQTMG